jgi:hypothetical protein
MNLGFGRREAAQVPAPPAGAFFDVSALPSAHFAAKALTIFCLWIA